MPSLIGNKPNQVPTNADLGSLAFRDHVGIVAYLNSAPTLASASTIQPTTPVIFVSGTTAINTITVPPQMTGGGQLILIPTGVWTTGTSGNIAIASTAVVSRALYMLYDQITNKWYPSY